MSNLNTTALKNSRKKSWKSIATGLQLKFKLDHGLVKSGSTKTGTHTTILADDDAKNGANFYCYKNATEWANLQSWASSSKGKKVNFTGAGLKNILRSEHIPYNIFYPLEKLRVSNPLVLNKLLESLLNNNINVTTVTKIKVEYASHIHKSELLNDLTSFDAYIEYLDGDKPCGIGFEIKYTEKSYPYGATEQAQMDDDNSKYNEFTRNCKTFNSTHYIKLRDKNLKQPWRNHLLGIKLVEIGALKKFHSVILYPQGNLYQADVCNQYITCLNDASKNTFQGITFEKLVEVAQNIIPSSEDKAWLTYFKERY